MDELIINKISQFNDNYEYTNYKKVIFSFPYEITIPKRMFLNSNLECVIFECGIISIGENAFFQCNIHDLIFKKNVNKIMDNAFSDNPLTEVTFNNDVNFEGNPFFDCGAFGETLTFKSKIEYKNIKEFSKKSGIGYAILESNGNSIEQSKFPIYIEVRNMNVRINKKQILSNINLNVGPGEMIMIIGGSGTGKSTLVKHLFGIEKSNNIIKVSTDKVTVSGTPLSKSIHSVLENQIFYAPQFTISNENLTVRQEIQKNAKMFNGHFYNKKEIEKLSIDFSLFDSLDTLVSKISGGQKKKLLMACSKAKDPQILIFDEPDSGLDEPSAFNLFIKDLRQNEVNKKGKTVIVISHHPHNYMSQFKEGNKRIPFDRIFTRLIVLAKESDSLGGTIAFSGPPLKAKKFFGIENDPYSRIVSKVMTDIEGGESTQEKIKQYIYRFRKEYENEIN